MVETQRIGLVANPYKPEAPAVLKDLVRRFERIGMPVLLDLASAELVPGSKALPIEELGDHVDVMVVLGGDGTILWVLRQMKDRVKPIAPINTGTLGFLTCATADERGKLVDTIANYQYVCTERLVIAGELEQGGEVLERFVGLNEVALCRGVDSRVIHVSASVNGQMANRYTGDGLILSTPTGSTAYSLSAGGPLVEPTAHVFVLTPICPHTLAIRPLVVDGDSRILFDVPEQRDDLALLVDGHLLAEISRPARITMSSAPFTLPLISWPDRNFFEILHQKLGWTGTSVG